MGGNALKAVGVETCRLNEDEYQAVKSHVEWVLDTELHDMGPDGYEDSALAVAIPAYRNKQEYGDLDVLVVQEVFDLCMPDCITDMLQDEFSATQVVRNGTVWSFDYNLLPSSEQDGAFQVDLIQVPFECFDFALGYFSYNDLGNLIGRVAYRAGFKFGHQGLVYVYRDGASFAKDIVVTHDFDQALAFLGFDPARHRQGFDNLEDIFEYVIGSEFFCCDMYDLELRSYTARTRDRKRHTYQEFLRYIEERPHLRQHLDLNKSDWLDTAFRTFEGFASKYLAVVKEVHMRHEIRGRYNGSKVMEMTGLSGKDLGDFIHDHATDHGGDDMFEIFLLENDPDSIQEDIKGYYEVWSEDRKLASMD